MKSRLRTVVQAARLHEEQASRLLYEGLGNGS